MIAERTHAPSFAADDLCATLEFVADYTERIDALNEQIEEARTTRNLGKHAAMIAIGRDMIAKGQQSKTLFGYTIRAGVNVVRLCACHGAFLGDCTTDGGPVHVIVRSTGEPWISVRRNKAAA